MFALEEVMVDPKKETEGEWFAFLGGELLVAHSSNKRFTRALGAALRLADGRNQFSQIDTLLASSDPTAKAKGQQLSAQREKVTMREIVRHVFLGFRGYSLGGDELADTEENRLMLLTDPRFRRIKEEVDRLSGNESSWREVAAEARAKNSPTTTDDSGGSKEKASGSETSKAEAAGTPSRRQPKAKKTE